MCSPVSILLQPSRSRLPPLQGWWTFWAAVGLFTLPAAAGLGGMTYSTVAMWGLLLGIPAYVAGADIARLLALHRGGALEEIAQAGMDRRQFASEAAWDSARRVLAVGGPAALAMAPVGLSMPGALPLLWPPVAFLAVAALVFAAGMLPAGAAARAAIAPGAARRSARLPWLRNPILYREVSRWLTTGLERSWRVPVTPVAVAAAMILEASSLPWTGSRTVGGATMLLTLLVAGSAAVRAMIATVVERETRAREVLEATCLSPGEILWGRVLAASLVSWFEAGLGMAVFLATVWIRFGSPLAPPTDETLLSFACLALAPVIGAMVGVQAARQATRRAAWLRLLALACNSVLLAVLALGTVQIQVERWLGRYDDFGIYLLVLALLLVQGLQSYRGPSASREGAASLAAGLGLVFLAGYGAFPAEAVGWVLLLSVLAVWTLAPLAQLVLDLRRAWGPCLVGGLAGLLTPGIATAAHYHVGRHFWAPPAGSSWVVPLGAVGAVLVAVLWRARRHLEETRAGPRLPRGSDGARG